MSVRMNFRRVSGAILGRMSNGEAALWAQPYELVGLGNLVGLWLEGRMASRAGRFPGEAPSDDECTLTPTLILLNRSGIVTTWATNGAAEEPNLGDNGNVWDWSAAFSAVTDSANAEWLGAFAEKWGFDFVDRSGAYSPERHGPNRHTGVIVGTGAWTGVSLGAHMTAEQITWEYAPECNQVMRDVLIGAHQITMYDPTPGRNLLWRHLAHHIGADYTDPGAGTQ